MVLAQNRSPQDVAGELGICMDTIKAWLRRTGSLSGGAKRSQTVRLEALEGENRTLKKVFTVH